MLYNKKNKKSKQTISPINDLNKEFHVEELEKRVEHCFFSIFKQKPAELSEADKAKFIK
jgi:hypothetical protein